jgi:hypothetical protein
MILHIYAPYPIGAAPLTHCALLYPVTLHNLSAEVPLLSGSSPIEEEKKKIKICIDHSHRLFAFLFDSVIHV